MNKLKTCETCHYCMPYINCKNEGLCLNPKSPNMTENVYFDQSCKYHFTYHNLKGQKNEL